MYLIYHVTSREQQIEGSCEVIGRSFLWYVTTLTSDHKHCDSGDMFLICHVASPGNMFM